MNKKILISLSTIAAVAAIAIGGTVAYFSDTETSTGNTFSAGTLNLQVGNYDPTSVKITLSNMKPGDAANAATWLVKNTGSIAGKLTVGVGAITNNENDCIEPEQEGDSTCGATDGELGANLKVAFWMDVNEDGYWSSGDYYLTFDGNKTSWATSDETTLPSAAYNILNNYGGKTWTDVQTNITGGAGNFRVEYDLPGGTGNIIQSDSSVFDITFTLNQQ